MRGAEGSGDQLRRVGHSKRPDGLFSCLEQTHRRVFAPAREKPPARISPSRHSKLADASFSCLEQARSEPCSRIGEFAFAKFSSRHPKAQIQGGIYDTRDQQIPKRDYGGALLWIMLEHSRMIFQSPLMVLLQIFGYCGVDFFLFLSGFGQYCSLARNSDPFSFYARKGKRLIPSFLPAFLVWMLWCIATKQVTFASFYDFLVGNLTTLSFWLDIAPAFNWYFLALPFFYLVTPLIKKILDAKGTSGAVTMLVLTVGITPLFWHRSVLIAICRIPIYVIGMWFGREFKAGRDISKRFELISYCAAMIGIFLLYFIEKKYEDTFWIYGTNWYPLILIVPGMCLAFGRIKTLIKKLPVVSSFLKPFWLVLVLCGEASLQIYLFHIVSVDFAKLRTWSNVEWILIMAGMVLGGILWYQGELRMKKRYFPKQPATPAKPL